MRTATLTTSGYVLAMFYFTIRKITDGNYNYGYVNKQLLVLKCIRPEI